MLAPAVSTEHSIVQRGPYSRIWQRTLLSTNATGFVATNVQSYTELATGICYLSNGQYFDSVEQVDPVPGGAQAIQGRHQVQWALNANTPTGAVTVTTPDAKQLSTTVFGLAYYDVASGSNATIAQLKDCTGSIVAPNGVVYSDAFSNVTADLSYSYTKAGLSQDIVLRQSLPAPDSYGLSDGTTILEIYTEFLNPPQPEMSIVTNGNVIDDQVLDFGDMKMALGQAFFLNGQDGPIPAGTVTKQWIQITNGVFLIESIPYSAISNQLQQLPPHASNLKPGRGSVRRLAFLEPPPTGRAVPTRWGKPMKLAKAETGARRLVIDYDLLSSSTNLTLQGDTTYFVTGAVNVTGTTTIEGGTVVKYTNSSSAQITSTNFVCQTGPYSPGVFTSMNDNSVGIIISNSTGAPSRGAAKYLNFGTVAHPLVFRNLRCSYANQGILGTINLISTNSITIWDCQFINCATAFYASFGGSFDGFPIYAYNVLFSQCANAFSNSTTEGADATITAVCVTADQIGTFQAGSESTCSAVNSLFTVVTNTSSVIFNHCYTNTSSNGVYQTVGAGGYYLAAGSSNRDAGTTSINSAVLADIQTLTTYPPVVVAAGWFTNDYTFFPQAQRDTDTPDRGYHYSPIDYAVAMAVSNATVTVLPGTVLAGYGSEYGVWLYDNAIFNCNGTATSPNYIVRYNAVQEQSNTNWVSTNWAASILAPEQTDSSSASFFFTEWSVLASDGQLEGMGYPCPVGLQDCQLYNGEISGTGLPLSVTNCLLRRVATTVTDSNIVSQTFYNNLFYAGELAGSHTNSGIFTFRDNLFNQTSNTLTGSINVCGSNAYVTTNFGILSSTNGIVILTNSPAFQTGALGTYYYPSNLTSPTFATGG